MPDTKTENLVAGAKHCPFCHALLLPGASRCWLCEAEVQAVAADEAAAPTAANQAVPAERLGTYSLASLMMFVTLASVVLGVSTIAPGVGIPLGIIALLAFVRTAVLIRRQRALGHQPHAGERAVLFAGSMGVVILSGLAAWLAFWFSCSAFVEAGDRWGSSEHAGIVWGLFVGLPLGIILGLYVGYRVLSWLASRERDAKSTGRSRLMWVAAVVLMAIIGAIIFVRWWF